MKAAVVVANEDVQYLEIPEPEVKPGYVKIKVRYSGICGSDIPRVLHNGVHFYPIVLGHEFSGEFIILKAKGRRKINCVMRRFLPSSSVGDRPAPCLLYTSRCV